MRPHQPVVSEKKIKMLKTAFVTAQSCLSITNGPIITFCALVKVSVSQADI